MSSEPPDLFSRAFKADPFPTFAALRRERPIYPHAAPDGRTIWYVTRYDDVAAVLRDDEAFCKDPGNVGRGAGEQGSGGASGKWQVAGGRAQTTSISKVENAISPAPLLPRSPAPPHASLARRINANMLFSDPPDHTRLRALVSQAFTPRRIAAMGERIQQTADALLDRMAAEGETDLIAAYALPLPVVVICDMLGIPPADRDAVSEGSQAIISPGSRGLTYSARKRKVRAFIHYLGDLFAQRQADPRDDLITALVQAEEAGDRLSEAELSSMVALLLVTGHETTVNLIGNGALALLRHPGQRERLRDDPALWPAAVEELLRYDGPVETSTSRWVRRDVVWGGQTMHRGDLMRAVITAANRDPAHFARPDELDVGRRENRHLAFGLGAHYCLGAPLARLEGVIALETLFRRRPGLALGAPPEALAWRSGVLFRGLRQLPVV
ncbi:cytochrome P450 [Promineifilum sp.]|uniref:cytochrome P450 family protein n=1 Tax=Promineifilum sp. TaxID=2664178 RepID=UPI0035B00C44